MIRNASVKVGIKIKPVKDKNIVKLGQQNNSICIKLPGEETQQISVDMVHDANTA